MKRPEASPPGWAQALLQCLLGSSDRDASADLFEGYRTTRASLGAYRADGWYIVRVLNILWQLIRPGALLLAAQSVLLALTVFRPGHHALHPVPVQTTFVSLVVAAVWYGSLVGAPGVSVLDAAIYFFTAYCGIQRTRLIRTGVLLAAATSIVGLVVLFAAAALMTPGLVRATFAHPSLLLILSVYLTVPVSYSIVMAVLAGITARWIHRRTDRISHTAHS